MTDLTYDQAYNLAQSMSGDHFKIEPCHDLPDNLYTPKNDTHNYYFFWCIEVPSLRIGAANLIGINRHSGELMSFGMYGE